MGSYSICKTGQHSAFGKENKQYIAESAAHISVQLRRRIRAERRQRYNANGATAAASAQMEADGLGRRLQQIINDNPNTVTGRNTRQRSTEIALASLRGQRQLRCGRGEAYQDHMHRRATKAKKTSATFSDASRASSCASSAAMLPGGPLALFVTAACVAAVVLPPLVPLPAATLVAAAAFFPGAAILSSQTLQGRSNSGTKKLLPKKWGARVRKQNPASAR
jgi:hypothetical protein